MMNDYNAKMAALQMGSAGASPGQCVPPGLQQPPQPDSLRMRLQNIREVLSKGHVVMTQAENATVGEQPATATPSVPPSPLTISMLVEEIDQLSHALVERLAQHTERL